MVDTVFLPLQEKPGPQHHRKYIVPAVVGLAIIGATFSPMGPRWSNSRILQAGQKTTTFHFLDGCKKEMRDLEGLLCTGLIVSTLILARDLNAIAPMITVCFLTYGKFNIVVLISATRHALFRPRLCCH